MIAININVTMRGRWTHCKPPENQFCIRRRKKHRYYPNRMFYLIHCKNSVAVESCGKLWISGEHSVSFSFHKSHDWFYHTQTDMQKSSFTHPFNFVFTSQSNLNRGYCCVYAHFFALSNNMPYFYWLKWVMCETFLYHDFST